MTDLLTQLRNYGRQIESDPLLQGRSLLDENVFTMQPETRRTPRSGVWALIAAAMVLTLFLPVILIRSFGDPATTATNVSGFTNGWVIFAADDAPAGDLDIFLTRPGIDPHRLIGSQGDSLAQFCPSFSPDGSKLAYIESDHTGLAPGELGGSAQIVVVELDDAAVSEELVRETAIWRVCPSWAPDSTRLAYVTEDWELRVATVGGSTTTVYSMNVGHTGIEWSPDGQVIAVWGFADESATNTGIWLVPVDGSATRLLATLSEMMPELVGGGGHMDWSPDSTKLALLGDRIHLIGSDGTEDLIEGDFVSSISWSPDGQLLAVTSEKGVTLLSPANSQEEHLVIDHRGEVVTNAGFYTWSPDGLSLLVRVSSEETSAIVSVPINPGEPETVIYEWPNGNLELEGIDWQGLSK